MLKKGGGEQGVNGALGQHHKPMDVVGVGVHVAIAAILLAEARSVFGQVVTHWLAVVIKGHEHLTRCGFVFVDDALVFEQKGAILCVCVQVGVLFGECDYVPVQQVDH